MGGPVFLYPQLLSAAAMLYSRAAALCPKSALTRDELAHVNITVRRTVRAAASRQRRPAIRIRSSGGLRRLPPENISVIMYATL